MQFSLSFLSGYLHKPKKYYNDFLIHISKFLNLFNQWIYFKFNILNSKYTLYKTQPQHITEILTELFLTIHLISNLSNPGMIKSQILWLFYIFIYLN